MKAEGDIEMDCPNNNSSVSSSICLQQSCLEISYIMTSEELHAKHFGTNIKTVHTKNTESRTAASHNEFTDGAIIEHTIKCVFAAHADCDEIFLLEEPNSFLWVNSNGEAAESFEFIRFNMQGYN